MPDGGVVEAFSRGYGPEGEALGSVALDAGITGPVPPMMEGSTAKTA